MQAMVAGGGPWACRICDGAIFQMDGGRRRASFSGTSTSMRFVWLIFYEYHMYGYFSRILVFGAAHVLLV